MLIILSASKTFQFYSTFMKGIQYMHFSKHVLPLHLIFMLVDLPGMYGVVLVCTVLYFIVLYSTVLVCTVLYWFVQCCTGLYCTVLY